ncbi:RDD family protein [Streptomyces sp. HB2AG]|nr:RDD family protein [Streptomyces sp. HB2AG]
MSSDGPTPGSGPPPEDDPFRKRPWEPGERAPGSSPQEGPPGGPPPGGEQTPPPPPPPGPWGDRGPGGPGGPGEYGPGGFGGYGPGGPGGYGPGGYGPGGYGDFGGPPLPPGMPRPAGSGWRLLARVVDSLLVGFVGSLVLWTVLGFPDYGSAPGLLYSGLVALLYLVYEGVMLSRDGQTVGKKLVRIRVAMLADGSSPPASAAWLRAGVYSLGAWVCCIFWLLDVLWHLWDKPYRQCLHDKAARTVVVPTD